jgi:uncharacterized DUF497 family protein
VAGRREFEWDEAKANGNLAKHGVSFEYATRVFLDPDMLEIDVSRAEDKELRRKAIGVVEGRLYVVVFTDRGEVRRLISARRTNAMEQRAYGPVHS